MLKVILICHKNRKNWQSAATIIDKFSNIEFKGCIELASSPGPFPAFNIAHRKATLKSFL